MLLLTKAALLLASGKRASGAKGIYCILGVKTEIYSQIFYNFG